MLYLIIIFLIMIIFFCIFKISIAYDYKLSFGVLNEQIEESVKRLAKSMTNIKRVGTFPNISSRVHKIKSTHKAILYKKKRNIEILDYEYAFENCILKCFEKINKYSYYRKLAYIVHSHNKLRIFELAKLYIAYYGCSVEMDSLKSVINSYNEVSPLYFEEFENLKDCLELALLDQLYAIACDILEKIKYQTIAENKKYNKKCSDNKEYNYNYFKKYDFEKLINSTEFLKEYFKSNNELITKIRNIEKSFDSIDLLIDDEFVVNLSRSNSAFCCDSMYEISDYHTKNEILINISRLSRSNKVSENKIVDTVLELKNKYNKSIIDIVENYKYVIKQRILNLKIVFKSNNTIFDQIFILLLVLFCVPFMSLILSVIAGKTNVTFLVLNSLSILIFFYYFIKILIKRICISRIVPSAAKNKSTYFAYFFYIDNIYQINIMNNKMEDIKKAYPSTVFYVMSTFIVELDSVNKIIINMKDKDNLVYIAKKEALKQNLNYVIDYELRLSIDDLNKIIMASYHPYNRKYSKIQVKNSNTLFNLMNDDFVENSGYYYLNRNFNRVATIKSDEYFNEKIKIRNNKKDNFLMNILLLKRYFFLISIIASLSILFIYFNTYNNRLLPSIVISLFLGPILILGERYKNEINKKKKYNIKKFVKNKNIITNKENKIYTNNAYLLMSKNFLEIIDNYGRGYLKYKENALYDDYYNQFNANGEYYILNINGLEIDFSYAPKYNYIFNYKVEYMINKIMFSNIYYCAELTKNISILEPLESIIISKKDLNEFSNFRVEIKANYRNVKNILIIKKNVIIVCDVYVVFSSDSASNVNLLYDRLCTFKSIISYEFTGNFVKNNKVYINKYITSDIKELKNYLNHAKSPYLSNIYENINDLFYSNFNKKYLQINRFYKILPKFLYYFVNNEKYNYDSLLNSKNIIKPIVIINNICYFNTFYRGDDYQLKMIYNFVIFLNGIGLITIINVYYNSLSYAYNKLIKKLSFDFCFNNKFFNIVPLDKNFNDKQFSTFDLNFFSYELLVPTFKFFCNDSNLNILYKYKYDENYFVSYKKTFLFLNGGFVYNNYSILKDDSMYLLYNNSLSCIKNNLFITSISYNQLNYFLNNLSYTVNIIEHISSDDSKNVLVKFYNKCSYPIKFNFYYKLVFSNVIQLIDNNEFGTKITFESSYVSISSPLLFHCNRINDLLYNYKSTDYIASFDLNEDRCAILTTQIALKSKGTFTLSIVLSNNVELKKLENKSINTLKLDQFYSKINRIFITNKCIFCAKYFNESLLILADKFLYYSFVNSFVLNDHEYDINALLYSTTEKAQEIIVNISRNMLSNGRYIDSFNYVTFNGKLSKSIDNELSYISLVLKYNLINASNFLSFSVPYMHCDAQKEDTTLTFSLDSFEESIYLHLIRCVNYSINNVKTIIEKIKLYDCVKNFIKIINVENRLIYLNFLKKMQKEMSIYLNSGAFYNCSVEDKLEMIASVNIPVDAKKTIMTSINSDKDIRTTFQYVKYYALREVVYHDSSIEYIESFLKNLFSEYNSTLIIPNNMNHQFNKCCISNNTVGYLYVFLLETIMGFSCKHDEIFLVKPLNLDYSQKILFKNYYSTFDIKYEKCDYKSIVVNDVEYKNMNKIKITKNKRKYRITLRC